MEAAWGGHAKARGSVSRHDYRTVFQLVGDRTLYDGSAECRVKGELFFGQWGHVDVHYETVFTGGDTRSNVKKLEQVLPAPTQGDFLLSRPLEDDRRLFDLTRSIVDDHHCLLYHRLDRLSLSLMHKWGMVRLGRQAVTWGDGLIFNPLDLLSPFSPSDIERDYKLGEDMVFVQFSPPPMGDSQFFYVPRRDPVTGEVEWDQSSLAGKLHMAVGTTEFDIMAASHFKDIVVGLGSTGYLLDAAWRMGVTWTFLDKDRYGDGYLSLVANMDYSWAWFGKNFYGFVEFFYNGLGHHTYAEAITDPEIVQRIQRGDLFTLDRYYVAAHVRVELHPLVNLYLTLINNLADPSGIIQPRATWDITQNTQVTLGGTIHYGGTGTEFGGFRLPATPFLYRAPDQAFLWITYFF
jgi:hypothetical protein